MLNDFCKNELKAAVRQKSKSGHYSSSSNLQLDAVIGKIMKIYPEMFHHDNNKERLSERVFFDEPDTVIPYRRCIWSKPK